MPELPEVQTVVDTLQPCIVGRRFVKIELGPHDVVMPGGFGLVAALRKRTVTKLARRAKRIVFTLDDGNRFFIHLGMTGQLTAESAAAERKKHTHLVATLDDSRQLRFVDPRRFGEIRWLGRSPDEATLGPEPLAMRQSTFAKQLASTRRAIKIALLDQRIVAGIGNIYADESLHAAGISPLTPARELDDAQIGRLTRSIKSVLRRAIGAGGSTLRDYVNGRGEAGGFQSRHRVYNQTGKPCHHCKTAIKRIVLGGRSTHFCPKCQHV
jgi:formamidopyrimidine-DNA glycosylase